MRDLSAQDLAVMALAAFRLTRLVTTDTLPPVQATRDRIIRWAGKESTLAEGLSCHWCAGFWVSLAVVSVGIRWPVARKALLPVAVSAVVGLLGTLDGALGRFG